MLGFLKNLIRRQRTQTSETGADFESEAPATEPVAVPQEPAVRAAPVRKSPGHQNGKGIQLPLQKVVENLPLELQPRVRMTDVGQLTISVPLEKILAQLSRGVVKVSFGELRQAAPEVFTLENDRDRLLVPLPLSEILARLNPALIARRRVQRQVEVPSEISSPFDSEGQGSVLSVGPGKPTQEAAPVSAPVRQNTVAAPAPSVAGRSSSLTVQSPPAPPAGPPPAKPVAMPSARLNVTSAPKPPAAPPSPPTGFIHAPAPQAPHTPPAVPPTRSAGSRPPLESNTPKVPVKPVASPSGTPSNGKSGPTPDPLLVSLTAIAEAWPDSVRKEIVDLKLVEAKVALPFTQIEQSLRQGRIAFSWKTIRSWIKPAVLPAVSAHDGAVLELPLKVVTPLFLTRQQESAKPHQKVTIDEDIPNLFFGFPQAETGVPVAAATARPSDTNYYVWDDSHDTVRVHESEVRRAPTPGTRFVAKYATPNEVVSRAAGLDGVAGAIIALPDGLMVANRLPSDLNADTLAAFLPQIFGKVSQCTKELRMGELNNLNFTVGNVPWKIFRVNSIFFAAFGRAGEPLPTGQLAALAAELDHKPK